MKEKFKQQLEDNKFVTEESLSQMKNKIYHNGDEVKVGDKPLFGMTLDIDENENKQLALIMLNENQIDLYESDDRDTRDVARIPTIKLK
jgi:hypothetical protein